MHTANPQLSGLSLNYYQLFNQKKLGSAVLKIKPISDTSSEIWLQAYDIQKYSGDVFSPRRVIDHRFYQGSSNIVHTDSFDKTRSDILRKLEDSRGFDTQKAQEAARAKEVVEETVPEPVATQNVTEVATDGAKAASPSRWRAVGKYALAAVTVILAGYSLWRTYQEWQAFNEVRYTRCPGYIVDAADVTTVDESGNTVYVRNDRAYYTAIKTNPSRTGDMAKLMKDYADLNGDAGRGWLALYAAKAVGSGPIRASSLVVTKGTTTSPEGTNASAHLFGTSSAANLCDMRYARSDDANGIYLHFAREEIAEGAPGTASALTSGSTALAGVLGLAGGIVIGAIGATRLGRRQRKGQGA